MEDEILKLEYLSNLLLDLPQILNLSLGDKTEIKIDENKDALQLGWA